MSSTADLTREDTPASSPALGRLLHACGVLVLLCGGCGGTEAEVRGLEGTYSMPFEPPMVIDAGGACERVITYAILSVGDSEHSEGGTAPMGGERTPWRSPRIRSPGTTFPCSQRASTSG